MKASSGSLLFTIAVILSGAVPVAGQTDPDLYVTAGRLLDDGEFEKAATIYEQLLATESAADVERRARILNNLGFSRYKVKRVDHAIRHYAEALALVPTYATCLNNMAAALIGEKRYSEALTFLDRAYRIEKSIKVVFNTFVAHYRLGREREALSFVEEAMRLDASYTEARLRSNNVSTRDINRLKKRIR